VKTLSYSCEGKGDDPGENRVTLKRRRRTPRVDRGHRLPIERPPIH